jgi:signal transduction histidine kinase
MDWLAEHMHKQYGLTVELDDDGRPKPLDHEVRALLFRAVRELLFNVLKHSQAHRARVSLQRHGDSLEVSVEDNGLGFTPEQLKEGAWKMEGFGLLSVRERLKYFGGGMQIESVPGEVTRVNLIIPLEPCKKTRGKRPSGQAAAMTAASAAPPQVSSSSGAEPPAPPACAVN